MTGKRLGGLQQPNLQAATMWLGLLGLVLCGFMYARKWKGAIIITVLFCSIISWIPGAPPETICDTAFTSTL